MVSITHAFAPPFKLIAPYFIIGVILYFVSYIFLFNLNINELNAHNPTILSWIHLFLLGFVMMIIFGGMAQLIPVVLEVGHFSVEFYYLIYPLLLIGTILMVLGFSISTTFLPYGGFLVLISMFIFLIEVFLTIKKVKKYSNIIKAIIISNIFLLIGVIFGILMALTYSGNIETNIQELVKAHLFSLVFGYIIITIMALSMILIPMFGLSHNFSQKPFNLAIILMSIAVIIVMLSSLLPLGDINILAYLLTVTSLIIYFFQIYTIYKTRARKENDIYAQSLFFSFFSFLMAIVLGFIYIFIDNQNILLAAAWLLFSGFFSFIITAHLYKIVPFLVWFERFSPLVGKQKVPMLVDMVPLKGANYQFGFAILGVLISTFALLLSSDDIFKAGISFISISAIFLIKNLIYMIRFK